MNISNVDCKMESTFGVPCFGGLGTGVVVFGLYHLLYISRVRLIALSIQSLGHLASLKYSSLNEGGRNDKFTLVERINSIREDE